MHRLIQAFFLLALSLGLATSGVFAVEVLDNSPDLFDMSLEDLMKIKVSVLSGQEETLKSISSGFTIITDKEIEMRGYRSIFDILVSVPGIQSTIGEGRPYALTTSRGLIGAPLLLLINGKDANDLWDGGALIASNFPLSNIDRVEVFLGPNSAAFGPNAAAGIFNIVTKSKQAFSEGLSTTVKTQVGSFNSRAADIALNGKQGELFVTLSGTMTTSDGEDFSGKWGFLENSQYSNKNVWGPLLDVQKNGRDLGRYASPSRTWGLMSEVVYREFKLGYNAFVRSAGYGPIYAADRVQNNVMWNSGLDQIYLEHEHVWSPTLSFKSSIIQKRSRLWGDWGESLPYAREPGVSLISFTEWNTRSSSLSYKFDSNWNIAEHVKLNSGINYEHFALNKGYDIPGYFGPILGTYSSTIPSTDPGPYGLGAAIGKSTDEAYNRIPGPLDPPPADNIKSSYQRGAYFQLTYEIPDWIFKLGSRIDDNSDYGEELSPRSRVIYRIDERNDLNLSYSESFTKPPAIILYGAYSGRQSRPDQGPTDTRETSFRWSQKNSSFNQEFGIFNIVQTDIYIIPVSNRFNINGFEYKGNYDLSALPLKSMAHFSYDAIKSKSNVRYNFGQAVWEKSRWIDVGSLPDHSVVAGLSAEFGRGFQFYTSLNWFSSCGYFLTNKLRDKDQRLPSHYLQDLNLSYSQSKFLISLLVKNLYNKTYAGTIWNAAGTTNDSGDDFSSRSLGLINSQIPQPGRYLGLTLEYAY